MKKHEHDVFFIDITDLMIKYYLWVRIISTPFAMSHF